MDPRLLGMAEKKIAGLFEIGLASTENDTRCLQVKRKWCRLYQRAAAAPVIIADAGSAFSS
jgi:hypothetical protein